MTTIARHRWLIGLLMILFPLGGLPPGTLPVWATEDLPQQILADQQTQLAERYRKVEELFLRLADMEAVENPERAALLRRAAKKSRESFILDRMNTAAGELSEKKFQTAIDNQKAAQEELAGLLKLLMSEDRPQRIREEKERISNWIKDLKRMERSERATRARNENGADLEEIEREQESIEKRAADVEAQLREDNDEPIEVAPEVIPEQPPAENESSQNKTESPNTESSESESSESESSESDGKDSDGKDSDGKESQQGESQQGESQQGESQQSESQQGESQQGESQQGESQQSESQQSESQEQPPKTPKEAAQRAVEKARKNMQQALEKLDKAEREQAVEAQRKAEAELRDAIEKLERILRQLREEEMLRELARLEARLRQMAQMQTQVLDKTKQLAATPLEQRDRQSDIRSGNLAFEEKKIVLEADRALLLLQEEGSSVAFPVVLDQMRNDMERVADRLAQTKIDAITQGIQEDILAALEEMIGSLQQAQRDLEKQQQQQQQSQQGGQQGEQPLVQPLAELKLLRTMQTRVKTTTERYGEMLPAETRQATDPDLLGLIKSLSTRQIKLYQISRDLLLQQQQQ